MHPRNLVSRLATVALLICATLLVSACTHDSPEKAKAIIKTRQETAIAKTKTVPNHYLAIVAKGNGGLDQLFTFQDVYPPMRLEVTSGLFDPKHANLGGGTYEMQIYPFTVLCTPTANGTTVTATKDPGGVSFGTLDLPQAAIVQLAVTYDGTTATVLARKEGDAQYSTVGTSVSPGIASIEPRLEVDGLKKGAVVGFDDIRVAQRGHRPGQLTPAEQALDDLYTATDHLANAVYSADGNADLTLAKTEITAALTSMTAASTLLDGLPASDGRTAARKKLASALKSANAASAAIDHHKPLAKIFHSTGEALCDTNQAARSARFL